MAHQFKVGDRVRLKAEFRDLTAYTEALRSGEPQTVKFVYGDAGTAQVGGSCVLQERLEPAPPAPALIALDRTYQTRDGRAARIYATDGGGDYPVHGAIKDGDMWDYYGWTESGRAYTDGGTNPSDLIEVKPEHTVWANIYPGDIAISYVTKEDADSAACADRIACIKLTYREGDGL